MKGILSGTLAAFAALAIAGSASAQSLPLSLEIRGGLPFPTGELNDVGNDIGDGLGPGYTLGGSVTLDVAPRVGVYAGYTFTRFDVEGFEEIGLRTDGFDAGLRLALPTTTGIGPWVKGGLVYHDAEVLFDEEVQSNPREIDVSERKLGFEVGGGVEIRLGQTLSFTPGVSYVRFNTDEGFSNRDVSYIKGDVGLRMRL
ncbi:MAG TPA: outer membrane beta-barrel protein [Longimicrobiaceae bacterium]|nr:outer membrane beta-barrel protein [Longimicrobiaceae bacterium]